MDKIPDELLVCPVCLEFPRDQVYQCINSHVICGQCSTLMDTCPICRIPFAAGKQRNRALEAILTSLAPFRSVLRRSSTLRPRSLHHGQQLCQNRVNSQMQIARSRPPVEPKNGHVPTTFILTVMATMLVILIVMMMTIINFNEPIPCPDVVCHCFSETGYVLWDLFVDVHEAFLRALEKWFPQSQPNMGNIEDMS